MHQPHNLPLTEKHLLCLSSNKNEMLERYVQELRAPKAAAAAPPPLPQLIQHQKNSDFVVASPRLLPFPYHNDAMFLPTAEQTQYKKSSFCNDTTSFSGTSRADSSSSIPPSPSFMSGTKRAHSTATTTKMRGGSNYSIPSITHHHRERRSLPARLDSFVRSNNFSKHGFLGRSASGTSHGSSSVSSLDKVETNEAHQYTHTKKPWLKRILKFFNKPQSKQHQQEQHHDGNPVWYCQYSKNPTAFEKYHNQKQMIVVS